MTELEVLLRILIELRKLMAVILIVGGFILIAISIKF
jgi:hypothetical protein